MQFKLGNIFLLISILFLGIQVSECWDDYELDLFDLVEEVNQNFYDFLGVAQDISQPELKKVYRKLSLKWHPDRNSDPEAELKFRNIVAVYDVLKDKRKRHKYNEVLLNGLPDWRSPSYYFRKARKLTTAELSIFISLIISLGHYFVLWAQHFEKKLTLEDRMSEVKKRLEKKQKKKNYKGSELDDIDSELQNAYDSLPSPNMKDTLPYRIFWWSVSFLTGLPSLIKQIVSKKNESNENEEEEENFIPKKNSPKKRDNQDHMNPKNIPKSDIKANSSTSNLQENEFKNDIMLKKTNTEWTDKEKADLIKAVSKYPAGTSNRWNKIADQLNRTPQDCISMEKQIKNNFNSASYLNSASWNETKSVALNHKEAPEPSVKLDENSNETKNEKWSQEQQKKFEDALKEFNKDTLNRWDKIAEKVPEKSKEDCMNRYKSLCINLKKKQQRA